MSGLFSAQGLGGLAVCLVGLWILRDGFIKLRTWPRAEGLVVAKTRHLGLPASEIEYTDLAGAQQRFQTRFSYARREPVGARVKIMLDPAGAEPPEEASIMNNIVAPLLTAGFGFWFAWIAVMGRG
ncbi:MAG: hypothetical protein JNM79_01240 [Burkholderiales bacterium]|nr:hypothetical protein [Burkholderiales bacterium]